MTTESTLKMLFNWKTGNLGRALLAFFWLLFPWFTSGMFDTTLVIYGLMLLQLAFMNAKSKNSVIAGIACSASGFVYLSALVNLINIATLWILEILLTLIFFVTELGILKFGPSTSQARVATVLPYGLITFSILFSILGFCTIYAINFANFIVSIPMICMFLYSGLSFLQILGWDMFKAKTDKAIMFFAFAIVAISILAFLL